MLNLEQLSNNKLPLSVRWRSEDICGIDYDQLYYDLDSQERNITKILRWMITMGSIQYIELTLII